MDKVITEENIISLYAQYLQVCSRVQAMEDVFFAWFNTCHSAKKSKEYRQLFDEFCRENLDGYINRMPAGTVKNSVRKQIESLEKH